MHTRENDELVSRFKTSGFAVLPRFYDEDTLGSILADIELIVSDQLKGRDLALDDELFKNLERLHTADLERYLATVRAFSRLSSVHASFHTKKVAELLTRFGMGLPLVPTGPTFHLISDSLKIPGGYFGQGVHQDWTSMQGSLNAMIFWVALTPVDHMNFPVEAIPGSHLRGLLPGEPLQDYYQVDPTCYAESAFEPIVLAAGDAVVISPFLVHRTGVAGRRGFRMATSYRFDDATEDSFLARGYPTAYRRSVERKLMIPGFPDADAVRKIYDRS